LAAAPKPQKISYPLTEEARAVGIISITDRSATKVIVEFQNTSLTVGFSGNWKFEVRQDLKDLGIDDTVKTILMQHLHKIEPLKMNGKGRGDDEDNEENEEEDLYLREETVCKYAGLQNSKVPVYESVLFKGKPLFVGYNLETK
jgi:hypothetical protein